MSQISEVTLMDSAARFWSWFAANEHRFRSVEGPSKEALLDEIQSHLDQYCDRLSLEIGGQAGGGTRELIISADGNREYFPEVREIVAAAPAIACWEIVAFKPAASPAFQLTYQGVRLDPRRMWVLPLESRVGPTALGLRVSSPDYTSAQHETFRSGCSLLLDEVLGEQAAAEDVQHLEVGPQPADPAREGWIELAELGDYIAWRKRKGGAS